MRPEFASALKSVRALAVSFDPPQLRIASKGKAAFMLKASSKKKRSRLEMEEVKHEEDALNDDKHFFL